MSGDEFVAWIAEMKAKGLAKTAYECAELLDLSANTMSVFANKGCDRRTALACAALLKRVKPYSAPEFATTAV